MRRFHKKSRLGCKQCKLRRSKCDEARPLCGRCSRSNLRCSFLNEAPNLPSHSSSSSSLVAQPSVPPDPWLEDRYGSFHLRLLYHFQHDQYHHTKWLHPGLKDVQGLFITAGFDAPYLMDELLAYAAAHKSTLDHQTRQRYILEATRLQTRALASYNGAHRQISASNCLPIFIFSSLLSHHIIFCMGLSVHDGLDALVDYLTRSIAIHRGLIAIAKLSWPMFPEQIQERLMRSCRRDIAPIPSSPDSRGECDSLLMKLYTADMDRASIESLCRTVEILQDRFDTVCTTNSHTMWAAVQDWLATIPQDYVTLLNQKKPEALVVLAHFAVLLHHVAGHWFVGDLGMRLIHLIDNHLGTGWEDWLRWPNRTKLGQA